MYKCNADTTEFVKINGLVAQGKIQFVTFISSPSFMKNLIKKLSNSFLIIGVSIYIYVCVTLCVTTCTIAINYFFQLTFPQGKHIRTVAHL